MTAFLRVHRDCFHDPRLDSWLQRIIDYNRRRVGKRHGNVALRDEIQSFQLLFGVITVIKEHLQPPQLPFEIVQTKHDATAILVGHEKTIIFGDIDFANLKPRLQKAALGETQQIERCFCFERFDSFSRFERLAGASYDQRQSKIFGQQFFLFH